MSFKKYGAKKGDKEIDVYKKQKKLLIFLKNQGISDNNIRLRSLSRCLLMLQKFRGQASKRMTASEKMLTVLKQHPIMTEHISWKRFFKKLKMVLDDTEKDLKEEMAARLEGLPIYENYLKNIRGIAEILSAALIGEIGTIKRFKNAGHLLSYSGFGCDSITGEAIKRTHGKKANFNSHLKMVLWKVSDCLIKSGGSIYDKEYRTRKIFEEKHHDSSCHNPACKKTKQTKIKKTISLKSFVTQHNEKHEKQQITLKRVKELNPGITAKIIKGQTITIPLPGRAGHIDRRAKRWIEKMFLKDLFAAWIKIEVAAMVKIDAEKKAKA